MNSDRQAEKPRRACFPRTARLLKPIEFKRVFNRNIVSSDRYFKVLGRPNNGPLSRLGMAVSRQVDTRAVGRNRIKRVVRESFRNFFGNSKISGDFERRENGNIAGNIPGNPGFVDLVVLPRRECATICNRQLFQSLDAHWTRIRASLEKNGLR